MSICFSGSRFPDSANAFNMFILPRSFGCREVLSNAVGFHKLTQLSLEFTSNVGDQVTHGTCPIYPKYVKYRQDVVWRFWMSLKSKCGISWRDLCSGTRTLVRLSPQAQRDRLRHLRQVTFRRLVLRTSVALEFTRNSDRNLIGSANS